MPAAGSSLQGVGAREPVGTETAAAALGPRLKPALPHAFGDVRGLVRGVGHEFFHLLDSDALARCQVHDLELHGAEWQGAAVSHRIQTPLEVAPAAAARRAALFVADLAPLVRASDAAK